MLDPSSPSPTEQLKQWLDGGSDQSVELMTSRPPMVDFRPLKGPWQCLPYTSLVELSYDPDRAPPLIATFSDHIIRFEGAGLAGLYSALGTQRAWCVAAKSLKHNIALWGMAEGTVLVESITIERRSKRDEPPTGHAPLGRAGGGRL